MYTVIYVQDNRTSPICFLHSYVTQSDPGTAQLINMAYFIHLHPVTVLLCTLSLNYYNRNIKINNQFKVLTEIQYTYVYIYMYVYILKNIVIVLFYLLIMLSGVIAL